MNPLLAIALLSFGLATKAVAASCPPLTKEGLDQLAAQHAQPLKLIFFASWCSSCKTTLTAKHDNATLLIGAFDKKERIEATIEALQLKTPCYFDDGVVDALGVKSLPRSMNYRGL